MIMSLWPFLATFLAFSLPCNFFFCIRNYKFDSRSIGLQKLSERISLPFPLFPISPFRYLKFEILIKVVIINVTFAIIRLDDDYDMMMLRYKINCVNISFLHIYPYSSMSRASFIIYLNFLQSCHK